MKNLQEIKSNKQSKYDEIIEYLSQDNGYWLENHKWDLTEEFFVGKVIDGMRYIHFYNIQTEVLKNEIKFYFLFNFKNKYLTNKGIVRLNRPLQHLSRFLACDTLMLLDKENIEIKWMDFLIKNGVSYNKNESTYFGLTNDLISFIKDFYDDIEETEKDIWYSKNIKGAKIPASGSNHGK